MKFKKKILIIKSNRVIIDIIQRQFFNIIYGENTMNNKRITLCGDDCNKCPRFLAKTDDELSSVAELWYRIAWRDRIVSNEEIKCNGCSSDKKCTYNLVDCTKEHNVSKCRYCVEFPCDKIENMLLRSEIYKEKCRQVCSDEEYENINAAFFNKAHNLMNEE